MNKKTINSVFGGLAAITIVSLGGCAFFTEPASDLPSGVKTEPQASQTTTTKAASGPATSSGGTVATTVGSYLIVAPIEDLPDDASNVAVVHFTRNNTDRALGLCKTLTRSLQITNLPDLPAAATNVVIWPVANDNAGATCLEMLTDYEPIDISVEAAKRVNEKSEGPFLLTQNMSTSKRMVFDMSYVSAAALNSAVGEWQALMGSAPGDWPAYRSAR